MQKELLQNMFEQNQLTCSFSLTKVNAENANFRLNPKTASAGFIYRHIAELLNLFAGFFGQPAEVKNTTMGYNDTGQGKDVNESKALYESGLTIWQHIIDTTPDDEWFQLVETPFFGAVTKIRLFSHVMFHNSHHCGQISLTLARGGIVE